MLSLSKQGWKVRNLSTGGQASNTFAQTSSLNRLQREFYSLEGGSEQPNSYKAMSTGDVVLPRPYAYVTSGSRTLGYKVYELKDHLGNIRATLSDVRMSTITPTGIGDFHPDVLSMTDYYAFGMEMVGRVYNKGGYRYGFNGKENDNEVQGVGNQQDYGLRVYDPRLGRFLSVDPLAPSYPFYSPYHFAGNCPITFIDLDGAEPTYPLKIQEAVTQLRNDKDIKNISSYVDWLHNIKPSLNVFSSMDIHAVTAYYRQNYKTKEELKKEGIKYPNFYVNQYEDKKGAYNCITAFAIGLRVLNEDYKLPITSGQMTEILRDLSRKGKASAVSTFMFETDKSNTVTKMKGDLGQNMIDMAKGENGFHVFGLSLNNGDHSVMVSLFIDKDKKASFTILEQTDWTRGGTKSLSKEEFNKSIFNEVKFLQTTGEGASNPTLYFAKINNTKKN